MLLTAPSQQLSDAVDERWPLPGFVHLLASSAAVQFTEHTVTLNINIAGLNEQPLIGITLPLDRSLVKQGQAATNQTTLQLGATVLATCFLLLLGVHYGIVMPLGRLQASIRTIHQNKQWQAEVDDRRRDEIGGLAHEINGLLGVIRTQVDVLLSQSLTDPLTGLANRRHFDQRLEEEISRLRRKARPLSFLIIDIDHFKQYNDHYGHPAGDIALKQVADVMSKLTRISDLPVRLGGEEFGVLLADTSEDAAMLIAEKLLQGIRDAGIPHVKSPVSSVITISIGVAVFDPQQDTPAKLVANADMALYAAKGSGRNRVSRHSSP